MNYQQLYTIFPRRIPSSAKRVFYYRTYDEYGNRTTPRSTGQTSEAAAHNWIRHQIDAGRLIPKKKTTFGEYADGWWEWQRCAYITRKNTTKRGTISPAYADCQLSYLQNHILPTFANVPLSKISVSMVDAWVISLKGKGLADATCNNCLRTFKKMMNEAERLDLIRRNPARFVEQIQEEHQPKGILSIPEVKTLFDERTISEVWDNDIYIYTANMLSACTGMRLGEVQAVQAQHVFDDHIHVCRAWSRKYGEKATKTRDTRDLPLPPKVSRFLSEISPDTPDDYIFSLTGERPLNPKAFSNRLYKALEGIGISEEQRRLRRLSFHSWRYFWNTILQAHQIPYEMIRLMTGHRTEEMTHRYTSWRPEHFEPVSQVQQIVLN